MEFKLDQINFYFINSESEDSDQAVVPQIGTLIRGGKLERLSVHKNQIQTQVVQELQHRHRKQVLV